ncbi:MAG TPA: cell division protein FtsA [Candidatus Marinimicrobia bacterium]|nr:cell division protein FtsA [Candidatus Neomarinimicrobiota bacterium]MDP7217314.1 cell division protein FtsA [Candidatus Neomarinimicrobiota bacterium]HJM69584.1 cell division protein FtsA [Candidatus Neomarinimicrobiota bacterium]
MNTSQTLRVGLDIGSAFISCAIAEKFNETGEMKLMGIGCSASAGLKNGSVVHREKLMDSIEAAVKDAELMAGYKVNNAVLSISGENIRSINTQGAIAIQKSQHSSLLVENEITENDVFRVMEMARALSLPPDRDIMHVLPQEYVIDTMDKIKDPVGMSGKRLEAKVHLITVPSTVAKNLVNCTEELGIQVDGLVYQGLASALTTLDSDEKELGVALVNIGGDTTDVVVYHNDGMRHSAVLGIGANSITNDIAVMLQIGVGEAEEIKKTYASAKASMSSTELEFDLPVKNGGLARKVSEHELSRYVEARTQEIIQLIAREIHRADIRDQLTYGVVLTGGGAQLRNIVPLAQEILNMRVRLGIPKNISGAVDVAAHPEHTSVIGLLHWNDMKQELAPTGKPDKPTFRQAVDWLKNWIKGFY